MSELHLDVDGLDVAAIELPSEGLESAAHTEVGASACFLPFISFFTPEHDDEV